MKINNAAKELIQNWFETMEDGDTVHAIGGEIVITNSLGCEIAREYYK